MQFTFFCLFTILFGYSLVIAAPVQQNQTDSLETKQQKATVIANRLLKELANEQSASFHPDSNSKTGDNDNDLHQPKASYNELDAAKHNSFETSEEDDEMVIPPAIEDLYQIYNDRFGVPVDDESSMENNDEDELGEYLLSNQERQKLIDYLSQQQDESDESLTPVLHSPVMDDTVMTAENHHEQRRRRRSTY